MTGHLCCTVFFLIKRYIKTEYVWYKKEYINIPRRGLLQ